MAIFKSDLIKVTGEMSGTTKTSAMELLQGREPLFLIHANNTALGNHKHGSLDVGRSANEAAIGKGVKAKLFEISCLEVEQEFEVWRDATSFYGYYGKVGGGEVAMLRPFRFPRRDGFLRVAELFGPHTTIKYNSRLRWWARSKLSKLNTVAQTLDDIITIKLLAHNYLSFHAAGVEIDGKAFLFAGLPNTGKTYLTIQLLSGGANFISEDIILIDKQMNAVGLPFTATMEKRRKMNLLQQARANFYQFLYKENFSKETFLDTCCYNGQNICPGAPVAAVFFLKRGKSGYVVADKKRILRELINLQHLEFSYSRNMVILAYLFFNEGSTIDDYIAKEAQMVGELVGNVPVYEVCSPDYTGFADLINRVIDEI